MKGEGSKDDTLNRVGVAPACVTVVRLQAGMTFAERPPTTRQDPADPTHTTGEREVERWIWLSRLKIRSPVNRGAWTEAEPARMSRVATFCCLPTHEPSRPQPLKSQYRPSSQRETPKRLR
jgi:hypothetical protein